jgi:hypothetical protein
LRIEAAGADSISLKCLRPFTLFTFFDYFLNLPLGREQGDVGSKTIWQLGEGRLGEGKRRGKILVGYYIAKQESENS